MKKKLYIILLFFITALCSFDTNKQYTDSLLKRIPKTDISERFSIYNQIAQFYINSDSKLVIYYARLAAQSAKLANQEVNYIKAMQLIGNGYLISGRYDSAYYYIEKSYSYANRLKNSELLARSYKLYGLIYQNQGKFKKAYAAHKKCFEISKEAGDSNGMYSSLGNIGNAAFKLGNIREALSSYNQLLEYARDIGNYEFEGSILNNISAIYYSTGKFDKMLEYQQYIVEIYKKHNLTKNLATSYYNLGHLYVELNEADSARNYYSMALDLTDEENAIERARIYQSLGRIAVEYDSNYATALSYYKKALPVYEQMNALDDQALLMHALAKIYLDGYRNLSKALNYANGALEIANKTGNAHKIYNAYFILHKIYKEKGDFENALEYHTLYINMKDSVYTEESRNKVAEFQVLYETEKNEKEIAVLKKKEAIYRLRIILLIAALLFVLIIGVFLVFYFRNKKAILDLKLHNINSELEYKNKEMMSLGMQIIQKSETLTEFLQNLKDIQKETDNTTAGKLNKLSKIVTQGLDMEQERKEYNQRLEHINKGFFYKVEQLFPDIKENEKRLLLLLKNNMSSKAIAALLNISSTTVDHYRSNLRRKLNIPQKQNFAEFFDNL